MKGKLSAIVFAASVALALSGGISAPVQAQTGMKASVVSAGATSATNGSAICRATVGQSIIGQSSTASSVLWQGFWQPISAKTTEVSEHYTGQSTGNVVEGIALSPNMPNPFSNSTRMEISLSARTSIQLKIYNAVGQEVQTIVEGEREAGILSISFDAAFLPNGNYTVVLSSGTSRIARVITKVD